MKRLVVCQLLSPADQLLSLAGKISGSEWLEMLIATGKWYAVPRLTTGADLFDGPRTWWSLIACWDRDVAFHREVKSMTPDERAALWSDQSEAGARARKQLRR